MGAWPCGTVVLWLVMYGVESKSQVHVYGTLHTFLHENQQATEELGIACEFYNVSIFRAYTILLPYLVHST